MGCVEKLYSLPGEILWYNGVMNETTRSQQSHSTKKLNNNFLGRTKPEVSVDYIVGLTDGEGCFYVNISDSRNYRSGAKVELNFHIKLSAEDRSLLDKVKRSLNCGNVYYQKEKRKNHAQCYRYTVASHRDIINVIVPFFNKHSLQSNSKRKNFKLFCKISQKVERKKHLTKQGIREIRKLKGKMNQRTSGLA
jgi:hypothetical protein